MDVLYAHNLVAKRQQILTDVMIAPAWKASWKQTLGTFTYRPNRNRRIRLDQRGQTDTCTYRDAVHSEL